MIKPCYKSELGKLYHGDCLDIMSELEPNIDMILADVPYGTTACAWDSIIPLEPMWGQLKRVIKPNGAIVMTASQPFTTALISSNMKMFKYEWIWEKTRATGFFTAKQRPLKNHENIVVFYKHQPTYNPEMSKAPKNRIDKRKTFNPTHSPYLNITKDRMKDNGLRYPKTVQKFDSVFEIGCHSSQKPVALMEYLIKTYTNEGETVLDFACGSGTTAIAAERLNRKWIGIEKELKYIEIATKRIEQESSQLKLFR